MASLSFEYHSRAMWLDRLAAEADPSAHDLCARHADRTLPPVGWTIDDRRVPVAPMRPFYGAEAS